MSSCLRNLLLFGVLVAAPGAQHGIAMRPDATYGIHPPPPSVWVSPTAGSVEISEILTVPNPAVGIARGEYVELRNREAAEHSGPIDLSGYALVTDSGSLVTLPPGTSMQPGQILVIDLAGGTISSRIPAGSGAVAIQTTFTNDFFNNGVGNGMSDAVALLDPRLRVVDGLIWSNSFPVSGPVTDLLAMSQTWEFNNGPPWWWVASTLLPGNGDIGFARLYQHGKDKDEIADWAEGNNVGPTPGTLVHWGSEEDEVSGLVYDTSGSRLAGVTVDIIELGLTTTTDANGIYRLGNVQPGVHTFRLTAPGHITHFQAAKHKYASHRMQQNFTIVPVDQSATGNTVVATIDPAGTMVRGPGGLFEVEFPPNFVAAPTQVTFSYEPPEYHSSCRNSSWRWLPGPRYPRSTPEKHWRWAFRSFGTLRATPHLPAPRGGEKATVRFKLLHVLAEDAPGDPVSCDTIAEDGSVTFQAAGMLVDIGGDLYTETEVTHFSGQDKWEKLKYDGKHASIRIPDHSDTTTDPDGEGCRLIQSHKICPGGTASVQTSASLMIGASNTVTWEWGGEVSLKNAKLLRFFLQNEVKITGSRSESNTSTTEFTRKVDSSVTCKYNRPKANPPDRQVCSFCGNFRVYDVILWGGTFANPDVELTTIAVPVGIAVEESTDSTHCN